MRFITPILLLVLTACEGGFQPVDAEKFLSSLEGPKVPTIQDTLTENARDAESRGDFAQAAMLYQQALDKKPDNLAVMQALGNSYRRMGDNDRAIAVFDAVLAKDPKNVDALEGKGLAMMAKGDFETPGALFGEVLQLDATRWKTLNALGILFSTRGMQNEAQAYYMEALKYSANNPSVLNNMGLSQALDKKFDEAAASLNQASAFTAMGSNDRKRIDLNLSLVYAVAGKLDDARMIAERYFDGATLNNNLGLYAHLAKDDQLAKAYLNMALTESKVFYERAWDNLQIINSGGAPQSSAPAAPDPLKALAGAPAAATPVPQAMPEIAPAAGLPTAEPKVIKAAEAKKPEPAAKPEPMSQDEITGIISASDDKKEESAK